MATRDILLNSCHGCFAFSDEFVQTFNSRTGRDIHNRSVEFRDDPYVIALYKEFGRIRSSTYPSDLRIEHIPVSVYKYHNIVDNDGMEEIGYEHDFVDDYVKLESENEQLKKEIEQLKKKVTQLETHVSCSPGGDVYLAAQREFDSSATQHMSSTLD